MKNILHIAGWFLTTVLLGMAIAMVVIATPLFGNRSLIVRSGSMEPAVSTGDLVVVRPEAAPYSVGDVIAFRGQKEVDLITTHRVAEIVQGEEGLRYITKGDANEESDEVFVMPEQVLGSVKLVLPWVGKVLAFGKTKTGFISFVIIPALAVIMSEAFTLLREARQRWRQRHTVEEDEPPQPETETVEETTPVAVEAQAPLPIMPIVQPVVRSRLMKKIVPSQQLTGFTRGPARTGTLRGQHMSGMDGLVRVIVGVMVLSLGIPSAFASYSDTALSMNNTFTVATDFDGEPSPSPSPSASPSPSVSSSPTPENIANHVVISEVQIDGATANEDFVELYNPTNSPIDLTSWSLRVKNSTGTESSLVAITTGTIPAHGFFLWANDQGSGVGFAASIGANVANSNNLSPNSSIALRNASSTIIDQFAWGNGTGSQFGEGTASSSPGSGQGLERKALPSSTVSTMSASGSDEFKGNGFDANNNATDFILRAVSQPQNSGSATESL